MSRVDSKIAYVFDQPNPYIIVLDYSGNELIKVFFWNPDVEQLKQSLVYLQSDIIMGGGYSFLV